MATYVGYFNSQNDITYKVSIETRGQIGEQKVEMGGDPFITSMETEGDSLYSHIRGTGATVQLVLSSAKFDIYSESPTGTKVTLTRTDTNEVVWIGYATPCAYDMPYNNEYETIEIECVDGLSVLKNIKFGNNSERNLVTFAEAIFKCLKKANVFEYLYVTNNVQMGNVNNNDSIIEQLKVSDQTFYEERDNEDQNDLDLSWSCYDVLKEIMQYLGYTIIANGKNCYIIDYDAIKDNKNTYFRYTIGETGLTNRTQVTVSSGHNITHTDLVDGGINLSMTEVYNKVVVKDDFYSIEDGTNITKQGIENITGTGNRIYTMRNNKGNHDATWYEVEWIGGKSNNGNNIAMNCFYSRDWRGRRWAGVLKFMSHPQFKFYYYHNTERNIQARTPYTNYPTKDLMINDFYDCHGAWLMQCYKRQISKDEYNKVRATWPSTGTQGMSDAEKRNKWAALLMADPGTVACETYILMKNGFQMHIGPGAASKIYYESDKHLDHNNNRREDEDCRNHIFFEYTIDAPMSFGGSEQAYIVIGGQILSHEDENNPYPITGTAQDGKKLSKHGDRKWSHQFFNWCRLQFGNQYWNGQTWQSSECDFKLWFNKDKDDEIEVQTYYDRWYQICAPSGSVGSDNSLPGYYIPVDDLMTGQVKLTVFCQRDWWGKSKWNDWKGDSYKYYIGNNYQKLLDGKYGRYWNRIQCWKDFSLQFTMSNSVFDDLDNNTATMYSNKLENDSVIEFPEVTFKLNTWDDKNQAHSIVYYTDSSGKDQHLTYIYNKALHNKMLAEIGSVSRDYNLRPEEHYIFRIVNQYESPRIIYDYNLDGVDFKPWTIFSDNVIKNKSFIVNTIDYDYFRNRTQVNLIEKV